MPGSVRPGTTGTPAAITVSLARILSPMTSMADEGGPTSTTPATSSASAKATFSARKPYPGWTASAPVCAQATRIRSIDR